MQQPIAAHDIATPTGLYAPAVVVEPGRLLFSSGFLARDKDSGSVGPLGDIRAQTRRIFDTIEYVLATAHASLYDIIKMTVFLTDRTHYADMNAVRRERLSGCSYASTTVIAALVDPAALIEIEVVARLPDAKPALSAEETRT